MERGVEVGPIPCSMYGFAANTYNTGVLEPQGPLDKFLGVREKFQGM